MADKPAILRVKDAKGIIHDIPAIVGPSAYEVAVAEGFKGTVKEWLDSIGGFLVDAEMLEDSTNPAQNKVVKAYVDGLFGDVGAAITLIDSIIGTDGTAVSILMTDINEIVGV